MEMFRRRLLVYNPIQPAAIVDNSFVVARVGVSEKRRGFFHQHSQEGYIIVMLQYADGNERIGQ
jgi:hypothetical protein